MAKAIQETNQLKENPSTESNRLKENIQKMMLERYYSIVKGRSRGNNNFTFKNRSKEGNDPATAYGNTQISITTPCLPQHPNEEDEELIFYKVEKLLKSFKVEPDLFQQIISYIKLSEELNKKSGDKANFIEHLTKLEQEPEVFNMSETFCTASVEDKYRIINAVFARMEMDNGKLSFVLRPPFGLFMRDSVNE